MLLVQQALHTSYNLLQMLNKVLELKILETKEACIIIGFSKITTFSHSKKQTIQMKVKKRIAKAIKMRKWLSILNIYLKGVIS